MYNPSFIFKGKTNNTAVDNLNKFVGNLVENHEKCVWKQRRSDFYSQNIYLDKSSGKKRISKIRFNYIFWTGFYMIPLRTPSACFENCFILLFQENFSILLF